MRVPDRDFRFLRTRRPDLGILAVVRVVSFYRIPGFVFSPRTAFASVLLAHLKGRFMHTNIRSLNPSTADGNLLNSLTGKVVLAVAATGLMALAAHVSLPLPFSPVPLTLAPFAVLIIGMTLGPATAFAALVLYLSEGAMGLPVFTPQGLGGVAQLLSPTGGYLFSYPLAAATAGWIARYLRIVPSPMARGLIAGGVATTIIFTAGTTWLGTVMHLHAGTAWQLAVAPFLPGEIIKIVAAAVLYSTLQRKQQS
jgi:biotin transport system substrate-specific component